MTDEMGKTATDVKLGGSKDADKGKNIAEGRKEGEDRGIGANTTASDEPEPYVDNTSSIGDKNVTKAPTDGSTAGIVPNTYVDQGSLEAVQGSGDVDGTIFASDPESVEERAQAFREQDKREKEEAAELEEAEAEAEKGEEARVSGVADAAKRNVPERRL